MLRVIRDGDVFVTERVRGFDHPAQRVASVAVVRVHVEIAADVFALHEARHRPPDRAVERIGRVARFRRQVGEAGLRVDVGLGRAEPGTAAFQDVRDVTGRSRRGEQQAAVFVRCGDAHVDLVTVEPHERGAACDADRGPRESPRCRRSHAPDHRARPRDEAGHQRLGAAHGTRGLNRLEHRAVEPEPFEEGVEMSQARPSGIGAVRRRGSAARRSSASAASGRSSAIACSDRPASGCRRG